MALLDIDGSKVEYNPYTKDSNNDNSNNVTNSDKIKNGLVFKREEVGGKIRYSYIIYLDVNPLDEQLLKDLRFAKEQLDNIIVDKKVEDKVAFFNKERLENDG